MVLKVLPDKSSLSKMAAEHAAEAIGRAICDRGQARIIAATAASQFEFLDALTKMPGIDWQKVSFISTSTSACQSPIRAASAGCFWIS